MSRRCSRASRALCALFACALLALSARPSAPPAWVDAVTLVAATRAAAPAVASHPRRAAAHEVAAARERAPALPLGAAAEPHEPPGTTRDRVLVERLYERNLALLC